MLENSADANGKIADFKFWASSIYSMNDPKEFIYGYDMLWSEVIPKIEKEIGIKDKAYRISELYKSHKNKAKDKWKGTIIDALYENHQVPFIVSFSEKGDFLPMWTTYANNGNGICLGFDNHEYEMKWNNKDVDILYYLHATTVNYNSFDESIKKVLLKMYREKYLEYITEKNVEKRTNMMINAYIIFSIIAAPYHKHKAYEYEAEARLIRFKNDESDVKYRCNDRGRLIPYIEVPVKKEYLKQVIIGPCADYVSLKRELICEFTKYDIKIDKDSIIPSNVPYRVY